jgi:hypothetical protein
MRVALIVSPVIVRSAGNSSDKAGWYREKRNVPARWTWYKRYLATDEYRQGLACGRTVPEVCDLFAVADLLARATTCATMPGLRRNASSAFSATP